MMDQAVLAPIVDSLQYSNYYVLFFRLIIRKTDLFYNSIGLCGNFT